jgi:hypothetical protein
MWSRIDAQRDEAMRRLRAMEGEFGPDGIHLACKAVWARALAAAHLSILHGDRENAERLLDRALHVLAGAPELARRKELGPDDLEKLLLAG